MRNSLVMGGHRHTNNAEEFAKWLSEHGVDFERSGGSGSNYFYVETPRKALTIRFSDHQPPKGRGGIGTDYYGEAYAHEEADLSVHPGGKSPQDARACVQRAFGKDWAAHGNAAQRKRYAEALRSLPFNRDGAENKRKHIEDLKARKASQWEIDANLKDLKRYEKEIAKLERILSK